MTNREWLNNKVQEMSDEELSKFFASGEETWCNKNCDCYGHCDICLLDWLKQKRVEPLPEIKNGMFIKVRSPYDYNISLGVIVDNRIVYQRDGFDTWNTGDADDVQPDWIVAVYDTYSFSGCKAEHCIWEEK